MPALPPLTIQDRFALSDVVVPPVLFRCGLQLSSWRTHPGEGVRPERCLSRVSLSQGETVDHHPQAASIQIVEHGQIHVPHVHIRGDAGTCLTADLNSSTLERTATAPQDPRHSKRCTTSLARSRRCFRKNGFDLFTFPLDSQSVQIRNLFRFPLSGEPRKKQEKNDKILKCK